MRLPGVLLAALCVLLAVAVSRLDSGLVKALACVAIICCSLLLIGHALMTRPR